MTMLSERTAHPFALLFPRMSPNELVELAEDIKKNGQRDPIIVMPDGKILDGLNRQDACNMARRVPVVEIFKGNEQEAFELVVSKNLTRRHLTSSQRAAIAADMEVLITAFKAEAKASQVEGGKGQKGIQKIGEASERRTNNKVAKAMQTNPEYVRKARGLKQADPALHEQVKAGTLTLPQAEELAEAPAETKAEALEAIAQGVAPKKALKNVTHPGRQGKKNGGKDEHYTPKDVIDLAVKVLGQIDLDPFSDGENVPAKRHFTIEEDGLTTPWVGATVWMNPPFSDIGKCVAKWVEYFTEGGGEAGIVLAKQDSRTQWFEALMNTADAVALHRGYLRFGDAKDVAPFPVAYFYYGDRPDLFCEVFGAIAWSFPIEGD